MQKGVVKTVAGVPVCVLRLLMVFLLVSQSLDEARADSEVTRMLDASAQLFREGKYKDAEVLAQKACEIAQAKYGLQDERVACCFNTIGRVEQEQGNLDRAESSLRKALNIYEQAVGAEHIDTAVARSNLGNLLSKVGKTKEAEKLLLHALQTKERLLGDKDPSVGNTLCALGELYRGTARFAEAEQAFRRVIDIDEAAGCDDEEAATVLNNLALVYDEQGLNLKAAEYYKRALALDEKALRQGHPRMAQVLHNLGCLYCDEGEYELAVGFLERALEYRQQSLGNGHPATRETGMALLKVYEHTGEEDAVTELKDWLKPAQR